MKLFLLSACLFVSTSAIIMGGGDDCKGGKPKCPPGYELKERQNHRFWCMKFFLGNQTFEEAEKLCRCQGGATLSGIDNMKELDWVMDQFEESAEDTGVKTGGIWVGAYRRKICRDDPAHMTKKPECDKENQFQWTDRNTIGTKVWKERWLTGAPHSTVEGENCVQLQVTFDDALLKQNVTGLLDNRVCAQPAGQNQFPTEGFVCGRPPIFVDDGHGYSGGGDNFFVIGAGKPTKKP